MANKIVTTSLTCRNHRLPSIISSYLFISVCCTQSCELQY